MVRGKKEKKDSSYLNFFPFTLKEFSIFPLGKITINIISVVTQRSPLYLLCVNETSRNAYIYMCMYTYVCVSQAEVCVCSCVLMCVVMVYIGMQKLQIALIDICRQNSFSIFHNF